MYLASILLFGVGSLLCGLAQDVGSFWMLLAARAVQAVGGGGIVPVATAEFGTTFPPEKRGLALGLVGGVYGLSLIHISRPARRWNALDGALWRRERSLSLIHILSTRRKRNQPRLRE